MNRMERRRSVEGKDKALRTLGQVAGREYLLQKEEGKEPTAEKLFNDLDKINRTALSNVGATDEEIKFVIQEAIKQAGNLDKLGTTKASKILKVNLKVMKLMPKFLKIGTKEQVMNGLGEAVGKEYTKARQEGKELSIDDLLNIQKNKWAGRGGGDMIQMYSSMGITEQEVRDAIRETVEYWKNQEAQSTETVGEKL